MMLNGFGEPREPGEGWEERPEEARDARNPKRALVVHTKPGTLNGWCLGLVRAIVQAGAKLQISNGSQGYLGGLGSN